MIRTRPVKIAVMGPESTGKSHTAAFLASKLKCPWVPEYAREYCAKLDHAPTLDDELQILKGQLALEDEIARQETELLVCDTMFLTVKIWSEYMFKTYPAAVDTELEVRPYDFFLIMNIDMPWHEDPLRDFPNLREHFLEVHIREISRLNVPFALISGMGPERDENALKVTSSFLNHIKRVKNSLWQGFKL